MGGHGHKNYQYFEKNERFLNARGDITYSVAEKDLLFALVEAEAGICDFECKVAVASVVLNRVVSELFEEDTIFDVIQASGQFQVVSNGRIHQVEISKSTTLAVNAALKKDTIDGALFFLVRGLSDPEALEWIDGGGYELVAKLDRDVEFYKVVE
jgi:spore germination cell wall hydrolase CwlJ-like protein